MRRRTIAAAGIVFLGWMLGAADPILASKTSGSGALSFVQEAARLKRQGKLEQAIVILAEAERKAPSERERLKAGELRATFEMESAKREEKQKEQIREAEKVKKLLEVDTYWAEPLPYEKRSRPSSSAKTADDLSGRTARKIPLIDFEDATLKEVVEFLAEASDVNIVMDSEAVAREQRVSVHLKDIAMMDALQFIVKSKKLAMRTEGNIIYVSTAEALGEELVVRVYDVQDLVGKLQDFPAEPFEFGEIVEKQ